MPGTHANNENTDVITVTNHQLPDKRYKLNIYIDKDLIFILFLSKDRNMWNELNCVSNVFPMELKSLFIHHNLVWACLLPDQSSFNVNLGNYMNAGIEVDRLKPSLSKYVQKYV